MGNELTINTVRNALPVFEHINDLYLAANSLDQQQQIIAVKKEAKAARLGQIIGVLAAVVLFEGSGALASLIGNACIVVAILSAPTAYFLIRRAFKSRGQRVTEEEEQIQGQMEAISQELYDYTVQNQSVIGTIPRDYRYYDAVVFFEHALANGRADSMKEAVNLYEEYLHRMTLESNSQQVLLQQQMQSQMMASIESSSASASRSSGIAAAFSVLNFLSN